MQIAMQTRDRLLLDCKKLSNYIESGRFLKAAGMFLLLKSFEQYAKEDLADCNNSAAFLGVYENLFELFKTVENHWKSFISQNKNLSYNNFHEIVPYPVYKSDFISKVSFAEQNDDRTPSGKIHNSIIEEKHTTVLEQMFYNVICSTEDKSLVAVSKK